MWAGGGHGCGDEEDEEDTRRQRAHLNTPDSRSGLVTREGGDGFTGRRAQAKSASQFPTSATLPPWSTGSSYDNDDKDVPHLSRRGGKVMKSGSWASRVRPGIGRKVVPVETITMHREYRIFARTRDLIRGRRLHGSSVSEEPKVANHCRSPITSYNRRRRDDSPDGFWHGLPVNGRVTRPSKMALHSQPVSSPILGTSSSVDLSGDEM
ncbi:hypothetical protein BKA70DRAFT_345027 [Coprinopsis sp. MPI-PUGE-AT-0042]|nr:hypothetical protein BKA70DRAFT_345027 [Coprinopsis sp. MPI-PUGE-AT-0042]